MRGAGGGVGGAGTNMRSEARQAAAERAGCCLVLALLLLPPAAGLPRLPRPAAAAEADQLMEWIWMCEMHDAMDQQRHRRSMCPACCVAYDRGTVYMYVLPVEPYVQLYTTGLSSALPTYKYGTAVCKADDSRK
jgi:hypothetical protein